MRSDVDTGSSGVYVEYKSRVGHQLTDVWSNTGVWLTVTFTVERYICVCFPMKAIVWCTPTRAKQIIIAVCVCAAMLTLPEFFATTTVQVDYRYMSSRFCFSFAVQATRHSLTPPYLVFGVDACLSLIHI